MNTIIVQIKMQALITDRCAMVALNDWRAMRGESQAYNDEAFIELSERFLALLKEMQP